MELAVYDRGGELSEARSYGLINRHGVGPGL